MSTKVITGKVRLCWPHLFEPKSINNGDPKYSVLALVPKSDTTTIDKMRAAEKAAAERDKGKWGGKVPGKLASIIHDADEDGTADDYPERKGHFYFSVSSSEKYKPGVVDRNLNDIVDRGEIYSGVYARLSLGAFGYSQQGNKGISFGLNHVQKLADGDPLDGRTGAADEFDALDDDDLL